MAASLRFLSRSFSLVARSAEKPIRGDVVNVPGSVSNNVQVCATLVTW